LTLIHLHSEEKTPMATTTKTDVEQPLPDMEKEDVELDHEELGGTPPELLIEPPPDSLTAKTWLVIFVSTAEERKVD
jgi:hypothetical protein